MEQAKKPFWQSKTLWTNLIMGVFAFIVPWVGENITPDVLVSIFAGVNMILRFITKDKLQIA